MSLKNRIVSIGLAMVMAVGMMSSIANAAEYNLHYTTGAGSTVNVTNQNIIVSTTGVDRITVKSTYFSTLISGAYCEATCITNNYSTNTATINSVNTYYLVYTGNGIPKSNSSVTVRVNLSNCSISRSVGAIGTITA